MFKRALALLFFIIMMGSLSQADLYKRAPDVIPGTLPEMRDSSYWIARMDDKADEVVLKVEQITKMNEDFYTKASNGTLFAGVPKEQIPALTYWWPGLILFQPDLSALSLEAVADTVKTKIKDEIKFLKEKKFGNILAVEYSEKELLSFEKEMALDKVGKEADIRYAISVRYTPLKNIPSLTPDKIGLMENAKTRWDLFVAAKVRIGMPLTVLHSSLSGEYAFVLCEKGYGWVKSEDIAFGEKNQIDSFVNTKEFVVCTGDRVPFYSDESCKFSSGWFGMGDRLPMASIFDVNTIKVPVRRANGIFEIETAVLKKGSDFHAGYLPFTRRNVVDTAFKLLGNTYDWTGAWFGRQHETTYQDIFACFGFKLPYHAGLFTFFGNDITPVDPKVGKKEQYKAILKHEPFITLQSCGSHAQLLLGDNNGTPIIFDQHGYGYKDEKGVEYEIRRCNIGDQRSPSYFLTSPITFLELK